MANLNKVFLMGNLTRDPEIRYTPSGTAVCDLGLAVNRRFSRQGGEQTEETLFVDVVVWARLAEVVVQYKHKGDPIFIEGRLQLDTWQGQDGQKRSKMRVVAENVQFLSGPSRGGDDSGGGDAGGQGARGGPSRGPARRPARGNETWDEPAPPPDEGGAPPDDDIPF